jgi:hypothetical protein
VKKIKIDVNAERTDLGFHVEVPGYPKAIGECRAKQNIALTARNAVSKEIGVPASRVQVMKVQVL